MIQHIIIGLIFLTAVIYLARIAYKQFSGSGCASGCGACNTIDFKKIEKVIKESQANLNA